MRWVLTHPANTSSNLKENTTPVFTEVGRQIVTKLMSSPDRPAARASIKLLADGHARDAVALEEAGNFAYGYLNDPELAMIFLEPARAAGGARPHARVLALTARCLRRLGRAAQAHEAATQLIRSAATPSELRIARELLISMAKDEAAAGEPVR